MIGAHHVRAVMQFIHAHAHWDYHGFTHLRLDDICSLDYSIEVLLHSMINDGLTSLRLKGY
jgi:hypothetical protein